MKLFIKIVWLLLLPLCINAQSGQPELDSLHKVLIQVPNDTVRMDIYSAISSFYSENNRDSSIYYCKKSIDLARQLNLKINEAAYLDQTGYELMHIGDYPKSLQTFLQAFSLANNAENGTYLWTQQKLQKPLFSRLDILASIYHDLGHLYGATGNSDKQMESYLKVDSMAGEVKDSVLQALANMNLGSIYLRKKDLDAAMQREQKALQIFQALTFNERKYEGLVLTHIGEIYLEKGALEQARQTFYQAINVNIAQNNNAALGGDYSLLGKLYKIQNKPDSGFFYAKKAQEIVKSLNNLTRLPELQELLSSLFEQQNNKDSALFYLKQSSILKDSIDEVEKKNLQAYQNVGFDDQMRLQALEKEKAERTKSIQLIFLGAFLLAAIAIFATTFIAYRREKKSKKIVNEQKGALETTLQELKSAQSQLIQSEKMASLGELTAGIAHEIQNPLNFVNNFSEVSNELIDELQEERNKPQDTRDKSVEDDILNDLKQNLEKINHHGKRADAIVKGMLQHSRSSSGQKEPTDINALCDEYLRLSYHGLRAKDKSFNSKFETYFDDSVGKINIMPQEFGRVILNLINNAFYAVNEKAKSISTTADSYEPTVMVSTKKENGKVLITVADNGNGIPKNIVSKIFQPFFTTKPTGQGTGLGLSLSYDIVTKGHSGELKVETKEGGGTQFIIILPV